MELPEALEKLGELKGKLGPLEAEVNTLRGHKERLEGDLTKAREKAKTAEARVTELEGKVPSEGTVILNLDDAKEYQALKALNMSAKDLGEKLEAGQKAARAVTEAGNKEALGLLGLKPSMLRLKELDGVAISAKKDGDKLTATVKRGDTETPWETFVKENGLEGDLPDFAAETKAPGVAVLPQYSGGGASNLSSTAQTVDKLNAERAARPNPLLKGSTADGNKTKKLP